MKTIIDITNDLSVEELNDIMKKFEDLTKKVKDKSKTPYLSVIYEITVNHIQDYFKNIDINWKQWSIILVKEKYLGDEIKTEGELLKTIDAFIEYVNKNYESYLKTNGNEFEDKFDLDRHFVNKFLSK